MNFHIRKVKRKPLWPKITVIAVVVFIVIKLLTGESVPTTVTFNIPLGTSGKEIAKKLDDNDIIGSQILFRLKAKDYPAIQAGTFSIPSNASPAQILQIITQPAENFRLTIPEGYTIAQIDQKLTELNLINSGEFLECTKTCPLPADFSYSQYLSNNRNIEGFLFPDTYFLNPKDFNSAQFLNQLIKNFTTQINQLNITNQTNHNFYEVLTMASILEKEIKTKADLPTVSGLLWKRLDNDWAIGADATLLYTQNDRTLTYQDLQDNSPYNTRKFKGLPPTPINNPGLSTIKAAMQPIDSEYWFYLTPPNSTQVIYGRTNAEHEANKTQYLR